MFLYPPNVEFKFTPSQLQLLSMLFQQNKYADVNGRKDIAALLNIPQTVIDHFFQNKHRREKLLEEELNRCATIKRNYAFLLLLCENNASNESPTCLINKEKKNISSNIRRNPLPTYPDEMFQLFTFYNKYIHKYRHKIIPRQFMVIKINNNYAIEFYRQYHMYMAKLKARDPLSIEVKTFSEMFPVIASSEFFQQRVGQMRAQNLGQDNPGFINDEVPIDLEAPNHPTDYESSQNTSIEYMECDRNNIPIEPVDQVCRKEPAEATQKIPMKISINTFTAKLPNEIFEQQDIPVIKQEINEDSEVFRDEATSVTQESINHGHHHSRHVFEPGNSTINFTSSQSSAMASNFAIQQQNLHKISQVHDIIPNKKPTPESYIAMEMERFKKSKEVKRLSGFIKYCVIKKTEFDQVSSSSNVAALSSQVPTTSKRTIPDQNAGSSNNSRSSVTKKKPMSNPSLVQPYRPLNLMKPVQNQTAIASGSRPLRPDCIQPSLIPSSSYQLSHFDNNPHSVIVANQFPAFDRVFNLNNVWPSDFAHTQSNASHFSNYGPFSPFTHIPNHAQPLVRDHIMPYLVNIAPNLVHLNNYNTSRMLPMPLPIPHMNYGDVGHHVYGQIQPLVHDRNLPYGNMESNHIQTHYNPTLLQTYDGGQLYIAEQAQPLASGSKIPNSNIQSNHIHPRYNPTLLQKNVGGQLYIAEEAQPLATSSKIVKVRNSNMQSNHIHPNYNPTLLPKNVGGQLYIAEQAEPLASGSKIVKVRNSNMQSNHTHPRYNPTLLQKNDGGQLYIAEEAQPLATSSKFAKAPNSNMESNHIHPRYNPTLLQKYDGGQLYIAEQAQPLASGSKIPNSDMQPNIIHLDYNPSSLPKCKAQPSVSDSKKHSSHVKSNHIHPPNSNESGHSKSDPTALKKYYGGQLYICEQPRPLLHDCKKPDNSKKSNNTRPSNHKSNRRSKSKLIPVDEYFGSQRCVCSQAQTSAPAPINPDENMECNSGKSLPTLISSDEADEFRLYTSDQHQPPESNDIASSVNSGNQPKAPASLEPVVIATGGVLKLPGNQFHHKDYKNLSGGMLREYTPTKPPVKPHNVKIGPRTLNKVKAGSPIDTCNTTQRLKTQPRPIPPGRGGVPKVEKKQEPQEMAQAPNS